MNKIIYLMKAALYECMPPNIIQTIELSAAFNLAATLVQEDLISYSKKDPSSLHDIHDIADTSSSFSAVLHYRLAHAISQDNFSFNKKLSDRYAALISQRGKLKSGADIHYRANIGPRFVLDHGYNTVIGETTVIGSDSYILGSVVLGARGISGNPSEARHPIIGNHVQIGAFSSILGNVNIGDHTFIGPSCTIVNSVPAFSRVTNQEYKSQILEIHNYAVVQTL
ncbi:serine O-acetyltransferase [Pseudomonas sp. HK3]